MNNAVKWYINNKLAFSIDECASIVINNNVNICITGFNDMLMVQSLHSHCIISTCIENNEKDQHTLVNKWFYVIMWNDQRTNVSYAQKSVDPLRN